MIAWGVDSGQFTPFGVICDLTAVCWVVEGLRGSVPFGSWSGVICGELGRLLLSSISPVGMISGLSVYFVKGLRGLAPCGFCSEGI